MGTESDIRSAYAELTRTPITVRRDMSSWHLSLGEVNVHADSTRYDITLNFTPAPGNPAAKITDINVEVFPETHTPSQVVSDLVDLIGRGDLSDGAKLRLR